MVVTNKIHIKKNNYSSAAFVAQFQKYTYINIGQDPLWVEKPA